MKYTFLALPFILMFLRKSKSNTILQPVTVPPNGEPLIGPDNFTPILPENTTPQDITEGPKPQR